MIISECVVCRRQRGKIAEQKMADLPLERIMTDIPPFTNVGVDYFGPIEIKKARGNVKNTFKKHVRSDNGTNFIGTERDLRAALSALNQGKIQDALPQEEIQ
jgi:hypothetical protein